MSGDHLSNEVSVGAELTPTGVTAKAKSRAISALDRLVGAGIDRLTAPLESSTAKIRAQGEADRKLIAALSEKKINLLGQDQDFSAAAFANDIKTSVRRQVNKDGVAAAALQDLRDQPPNSESTASGPETLDPDFLNRFERYAEDATSDQLRERWGRVLATEIRKPGTFSMKVMRAVDEIDAPTAALFESLCANRFDKYLIGCLTGEIKTIEKIKLVSAGLIAEPGLTGHNLRFREVRLGVEEMWCLSDSNGGFGFPKNTTIPSYPNQFEAPLVTQDNGVPAVPIYILTDVGVAISTILPDTSSDVLRRYCETLSKFCQAPIYEFQAIPGALLPIRVHKV